MNNFPDMNEKNTGLMNDVFLLSCFFYFSYIGLLLLYILNYWHDFLEVKTLSLENRMFLMNYNNFHYEHGIWLPFFAISSIFLILFLEPKVFIDKFYIYSKLKNKIWREYENYLYFRMNKRF